MHMHTHAMSMVAVCHIYVCHDGSVQGMMLAIVIGHYVVSGPGRGIVCEPLVASCRQLTSLSYRMVVFEAWDDT